MARAINAARGGVWGGATGVDVGVGRGIRVPGGGGVSRASASNLGSLWGRPFRGDGESYESLSKAEAQADAVPATATVDRSTNTLQLTGRRVALAIVANPPNGRDMAFRVAVVADPTF